MERPQAGDIVATMSGKKVGTVGSVLEGRIELVTNDRERIWLVEDAVFEAGFGRVTLVCEEGGLRQFMHKREAAV